MKLTPSQLRAAASELARRAGATKSEAKSEAARNNGKLGGRPKSKPQK